MRKAEPSSPNNLTQFARIAIFGCRNIDAASVYSLMNGQEDIEIVLFGGGAETLRREVAWLCAAVPPKRHARLRVGASDDLAGAQIALISSGEEQRAGQSDQEHLRRNAAIVAADAEVLTSSGFKGILIVTTGPAEVMAHVALDVTCMDERRVIGLGPGSMAAREEGVPGLRIATWCTATCSVKSFMDSCHPDCPYFEDTLERYQHSTGIETGPNAAMASCVMRVCEAILTDEHAVLPVCVMTRGELGISGVFLMLPCIIGHTGIESVLGGSYSSEELQQLLETAQFIGRLHHGLIKTETAAAH
jgi:L-lactate dehydrogenase